MLQIKHFHVADLNIFMAITRNSLGNICISCVQLRDP